MHSIESGGQVAGLAPWDGRGPAARALLGRCPGDESGASCSLFCGGWAGDRVADLDERGARVERIVRRFAEGYGPSGQHDDLQRGGG